ncbi:hypothetical protein FA281_26505 [Pseudomonas aeruginosa]|nr:hypothetical protein [Pseudomonas aeruginosa]
MDQAQVLRRFEEEVLALGAESTLPINLSYYWLSELYASIERVLIGLEQGGAGFESYISLPLVAITHILLAKKKGIPIGVTIHQMLNYFEDYKMELALELAGRTGRVKVLAATIDTIFTGRDVRVSL